MDGYEAEYEVREWRNKNERELRVTKRKRDEWWNKGLAKECQRENGSRSSSRGGEGTVRGRGGRRGQCGGRMDEDDEEFLYHIKIST